MWKTSNSTAATPAGSSAEHLRCAPRCRRATFPRRCVETLRYNERRHHGGSLGTRSEPANNHAFLSGVKSRRALRGIFGQADPFRHGQRGEAVPSLEQVVIGLIMLDERESWARSACSQASKWLSSGALLSWRIFSRSSALDPWHLEARSGTAVDSTDRLKCNRPDCRRRASTPCVLGQRTLSGPAQQKVAVTGIGMRPGAKRALGPL